MTRAVARLPRAGGGKVNATDDQGRTPRSWAGEFGQASEIGDWLIEHNFN
jgi:hypothetical protein